MPGIVWPLTKAEFESLQGLSSVLIRQPPCDFDSGVGQPLLMKATEFCRLFTLESCILHHKCRWAIFR